MSDSKRLTHPNLSRPRGPARRAPRPRNWGGFVRAQRAGIQNELQALQRGDAEPDLSRGLAKYMLSRSVMGRRFESDQAQRLMSADATVNQTRQILSEGRGNVTTDVETSGGESTWRTKAGRTMRDAISSRLDSTVTARNPGLTSAMAAMAVRAGNCGEHGTVATHLDAQRLATENRTDEAAYRASSTATDHGWSERRQLDGRMRQTDILMDAWGEGSAVERSDSAFGQNVRTRYHYSTSHMPTHDFRDEVGGIPRNIKAAGQQKFDQLKRQDYRFSKNWRPTSVYGSEFRQQAREAVVGLGTLDQLRKVGDTDLRAGFGLEQRVRMRETAGARRNLLMDIHKVGVLRTAGASLRTAKAMK